MARAGGGVSAPVPGVRRRHPADLVHHRARGDGRQEPAPFEPEVRKRAMATMALTASSSTAAHFSRSRAAHRLARTRAGPRRP
jgi:hypothetical protein